MPVHWPLPWWPSACRRFGTEVRCIQADASVSLGEGWIHTCILMRTLPSETIVEPLPLPSIGCDGEPGSGARKLEIGAMEQAIIVRGLEIGVTKLGIGALKLATGKPATGAAKPETTEVGP